MRSHANLLISLLVDALREYALTCGQGELQAYSPGDLVNNLG
jgi:hypothetical protein